MFHGSVFRVDDDDVSPTIHASVLGDLSPFSTEVMRSLDVSRFQGAVPNTTTPADMNKTSVSKIGDLSVSVPTQPSGFVEGSFLPVNQLSPLPKHFAKQSSFFTQSSPAALLMHLSAVFASMEGVDHLVKPAKCKINGFASGLAGRCGFKVSLFCERERRMLCEFQRREGCVVFFNKFWRKTLEFLGTHSPSFPTASPPALPESLPPPVDLVQCPKFEYDPDTVQHLLAMAGSQNVDIQREGCAALAGISQSACLLPAFPKLLPLLDKLLMDGDTEIRRSLGLLLANLSQHSEAHSPLITCLLERVLTVLDEPSHIAHQDCKRHMARALFACCHTPHCRQALLARASVLGRLETSHDSALQASVAGTLRLLREM